MYNHLNSQYNTIKIGHKTENALDIVKSFEPTIIINLSASRPDANFKESLEANLIYQTNFLASINLLEVLKTKPFSAYVYTGSSSEYGQNCQAPLENSDLIPNSHYSVSKISNFYLQKYYSA